MDPVVIVVTVIVTIVAVVVLRLVVGLLLAGGDIQRLKLAVKSTWKVLRDDEFAGQVEKLLAPPETEDKLDGTPIRLLTVLQRDGRLVDFLMEDLEGATDEQIAAGVREIHKDCRKVLEEHVTLQPVIAKEEGDTVTVKAGFDPSAIQLTGNVTGEPPFKGELQHAGWRVTDIKLAEPAEGVDDLVLQPAEVELK